MVFSAVSPWKVILFPFVVFPWVVSDKKMVQTTAVARLTRFEGRGHKKVPKGPPFAYVFWKKFQRVPPLLMFFEKISKGSPHCLCFLKKFQNKLSKGGVLAFSHLPLDFTAPPLNAPLDDRLFDVMISVNFPVNVGEWCTVREMAPSTGSIFIWGPQEMCPCNPIQLVNSDSDKLQKWTDSLMAHTDVQLFHKHSKWRGKTLLLINERPVTATRD